MAKLNPGRRARIDQVLASAKAQSINNNTLVTVITAVDGNLGCSWCDCPDIDHSGGRIPPGCIGCSCRATDSVHWFNPGGHYRGNIPVCAHHITDYLDTFNNQMGSPPEVVLYDPNPIIKGVRQ